MNNAKLLAKMFGKTFDRVPTIILNADINTKKIFISNIDDNLPLSKTAMAGIKYIEKCIKFHK